MSSHIYRAGGGIMMPTCTYVWYIGGADRHILVDSGATKELVAEYGLLGRYNVQSVEQGLAKLGLKPQDIDLVIQTQLHYDHVGLAVKFRKAKFLVQKAELDFAQNPHPSQTGLYDMKLFDGSDIEVIDGDYEVEDGIKLWLTPGHTPGGQSVVVNTSSGKAIIDGMCAIDEAFDPPGELKKKMPVVASAVNVDVIQAYESLVRVKEGADLLIPQHSIRFAFIDKL